MNKDDKKAQLCPGCREDYYNHGGHSTTGECWMLNSSKVVERTMVGVWQNPPYKWQPRKTLSCHCPQGAVWIKEDDPRIVRVPTPDCEPRGAEGVQGHT